MASPVMEELNVGCPACHAGPAQYCYNLASGSFHPARTARFVEKFIDRKTTPRVRPSFESIYMQMAVEIAKRSTCARLNVGCVVSSEDFRQVLGVGYNGNASGLPNGCDSTTPGACGCLHAEMNAIINCRAPRDQAKIVLVTDLPCKMCSKALVNLGGVRKVHYLREYRLREGVEVLGLAGIPIEQLFVEGV